MAGEVRRWSGVGQVAVVGGGADGSVVGPVLFDGNEVGSVVMMIFVRRRILGSVMMIDGYDIFVDRTELVVTVKIGAIRGSRWRSIGDASR